MTGELSWVDFQHFESSRQFLQKAHIRVHVMAARLSTSGGAAGHSCGTGSSWAGDRVRHRTARMRHLVSDNKTVEKTPISQHYADDWTKFVWFLIASENANDLLETDACGLRENFKTLVAPNKRESSFCNESAAVACCNWCCKISWNVLAWNISQKYFPK